jgi:hypothetical protein
MVKAEAQVKDIIRSYILNLNLNPHYSRALLLQSPICCCKVEGKRLFRREVIERGGSSRAWFGGLAPRTFDVLHEYASDPPGSARRSRDAAGRFCDELS